MATIRPRFEVHEVEGEKLKRRVCVHREDGGFDYKDVEEKRRVFDVYFPNGHSVRIRGEDEMRRQGFLNRPALVDMETGDVVPDNQPMSLKTHVERSTKPSKSKGMNDGEA